MKNISQDCRIKLKESKGNDDCFLNWHLYTIFSCNECLAWLSSNLRRSCPVYGSRFSFC